MVGWNMAPPPPGPMIVKLPGRCSNGTANVRAATTIRRRENTISYFPLLSLALFSFLFWQNFFALSILLTDFDWKERPNCPPETAFGSLAYTFKFRSRAAFP